MSLVYSVGSYLNISGKLDFIINYLDNPVPHLFQVIWCPLTHPVLGFEKFILSYSNVSGNHTDLLGSEPLLCNCGIKMTTAAER